MNNNVKFLLIGLFCLQLLVGTGFELAHDEAYYWVFSNHLDWGYFDHPPMVAFLIKIFSFLPHSEISVRTGFILIQIITVFLLVDLVPKDKKIESTFLFFGFPLASMVGLFALPDMPLLFFTTVYLWVLRNYLFKDDVKNSLLLGLVIALLLYSKYHGILLIIFTLIAIPKLLIKRSFYIIFATALVLFFPHILWQYDHNFSTIRYHFLERPKAPFSIPRSLEYLGIQIIFAGVFLGPMIWWTTIKHKSKDAFEKVLKFNAIGIIIFFLISTFSKKVEANWTIQVTIPLIILSLSSNIWNKLWLRNLMLSTFLFILVARLALVIELPLKRSKEFHGWREWVSLINEKCSSPWIANTYQMASKLSFYLNQPVHALNYHSRKNQFDYWSLDKSYYKTEKVCYLTNSKQFGGYPVQTPDGKPLFIVQNMLLKDLFDLKQRARLEKL